MEHKTNVMRLLDRAKINYKHYCYEGTGAVSAVEVAQALAQNAKQVFKTLVTVGKSNKYYVFVVPAAAELDLKKVAHCTGEKAVDMLKTKDLLPLTGYIHGGCSPVGMKKFFQTTIDISAKDFGTIIFSAGKIGYQVEVGLGDLSKIIDFGFADIVVEN